MRFFSLPPFPHGYYLSNQVFITLQYEVGGGVMELRVLRRLKQRLRAFNKVIEQGRPTDSIFGNTSTQIPVGYHKRMSRYALKEWYMMLSLMYPAPPVKTPKNYTNSIPSKPKPTNLRDRP